MAADFGLALTEEQNLTKTGELLGTLRYMSPERFSGQCDARSDIYALGMTLYELLAFKPAFAETDQLKLIEQIGHKEPPSLRKSVPDLPRDLETIVVKATDKDPNRRYQTAADLEEDLRRFLAFEPILSERSSPAQKLSKWIRRRPAISALLAALIVVTVAGTSGVVWKWREAEANAVAATAAQRIAETAEKSEAELLTKSQFQLASLQASNGVRLLDNSDVSRAIPWLVAAQKVNVATATTKLPMTLHERDLLQAGRMRLNGVLGECPSLIARWHFDDLTWLEFSPDGSRLAVGGGNSTQLWDVTSGTPASPLLDYVGSVQYGDASIFSPDGKRMVLTNPISARIFDASTGKPVSTNLPLSESPQRCLHFAKFTADGRRVMTFSHQDGTLRIWDSGELVFETQCAPYTSAVRAGLSPDGLRIVTQMAEKGIQGIQIFDLKTGAEATPFMDHGDRLWATMFGPKGNRVVSVCSNSAQVWDARSGTLIHSLEYDKRLFFGSKGPRQNVLKQVRQIAENTRSWPAINPSSENLVISPDGHTMLTTSPDEQLIELRDITTGRLVTSPWSNSAAFSWATFSSDGGLLATASRDGIVSVWDIRNPRASTRILSHDAGVRNAEFSRDGNRVLTSCEDGAARLWNLDTETLSAPVMQHTDVVRRANFFADDRWVVTYSDDRSTRVWNGRTGEPESMPIGQGIAGHGISNAWASPDGQQLCVTYFERFNLFDWRSGRRVAGNVKATWLPNEKVWTVAFHPSGKQMAIATSNTVSFWDTVVGVELEKPVQGRPVGPLSYSSHGLYLVFGRKNEHSIVVLDGETKKLLRIIQIGGEPSCLRFNPANEEHLLIGRQDGVAQLWNVVSGQPVTDEIRHNGRITDVALSNDGKWFATASEDGTAKVLSTTIGQVIAPSILHRGPVLSVDFSPDSSRIVTASEDGTARVWDLPSDIMDVELDDVSQVASVLSSRSLNENGLVSLDAKQQLELWRANAGQHDVTSVASPATTAAWQVAQLKECERLENWGSAVFYLDKLLEKNPTDADLLRRRADAQASVGNPVDAVADYDRVLELVTNDPAAMFHRGRMLFQLGRHDEALESFEQFVHLYPDHGTGGMYLNTVERTRNGGGQPDESLQQVIRLSDAIRTPLDRLWDDRLGPPAQTQQSSWKEYIADCNWKDENATGWQFRNRGIAHAAIGDWQSAAEDLTASLKMEPNDVLARRVLARVLAESSEWAKVDAVCEVVGEVSGDWELWYLRGLAHRHLSQWSEAVTCCSKSIEIKPTHAGSHFVAGLANSRLERLVQAKQHFVMASQLATDKGQTILQCGRAYFDSSQWAEAADQFTAAREHGRNSFWDWHQSAIACLGAGRTAEFEEACSAMLDLIPSPQYRGMSQALSSVMVLSNSENLDWPSVFPLMEKANAYEGREVSTKTLGMVEYRCGDYEAAIKRLSALTGGWPGWGGNSCLAMAHHQLGNQKKAEEYFGKAVAYAERVKSTLSVEEKLEVQLLFKEVRTLLKLETAATPE